MVRLTAVIIAAALPHNGVLQELDLSGNEISAEACAKLGDSLRGGWQITH